MCKLPRAWESAKKQKKSIFSQFVLPFPKAVHSPSVFFHMEKQNKSTFGGFYSEFTPQFIYSAGNWGLGCKYCKIKGKKCFIV